MRKHNYSYRHNADISDKITTNTISSYCLDPTLKSLFCHVKFFENHINNSFLNERKYIMILMNAFNIYINYIYQFR